MTGEEVTIQADGYEAVVRRRGASLHRLRYDGRDLLLSAAEPGDPDEPHDGAPGDEEADPDRAPRPQGGTLAQERPPDFAGSVLAPWPNRVVDGRYTFEGDRFSLEVNEPSRGHALHGLVWSMSAEVLDVGPAHVSLVHRLRSAPGYPFEVDVTTRYAVGPAGLSCEIGAVNVGGRRAPYGCGAHPYLRASTGRTDDLVLQLAAARRLELSGDRLVPQGLVPVAGTEYDFAGPRQVEGLSLDAAFTGLVRGDDGLARVRVTDPGGAGVEMWMDAAFRWLQVFTADEEGAWWFRRGLAVEPMTCPPDAFSSGIDLVALAPGEAHHAAWGVRAVAAAPD